MLRRWQSDLERQGYKAIYFNAWEDDFCEDPLLATIGQLSDYFKATGLEAVARRAADIAIPLIMENLTGILKAKTGIPFSLNQFKNREKTLFDKYSEKRATKNELKKELTNLASRVAKDTGHPLVFIVDELDRCRPTFAIELLERVKHIFDVPNLVFLFGINRDELSKSLRSVYGEIETDVYLRRFFDFEFNLREVDSRRFAESLIDRFKLGEVFQSLSHEAGNPSHMYDFQNFRAVCPLLWSALNLPLRDIDYSIRLIALLAKRVELGAHTHPYLVALLIGFKFKRRYFYDSWVSGKLRTSEVVNYLANESVPDPTDSDLNMHFDRIEGFLYCADLSNRAGTKSGSLALTELKGLSERRSGAGVEILSNRARIADQERLDRIKQAILDGQLLEIDQEVFARLAKWIDTYQEDLRR